MTIYHERMLTISDYVRDQQTLKSSALRRKADWMNEGLYLLWRECANVKEFARRGNMNASMARKKWAECKKRHLIAG